VIDSISEIEAARPLKDNERYQISARLRQRTAPARDAAGTSWTTDAVVAYSDTVFSTKFSIADGGMVEMTDDNPLFGDLDFKGAKFRGQLRAYWT
jgi:hypothetical protein